ncbi:MAG: L,D-transpeptidase family protein [Roseovarius sp.]
MIRLALRAAALAALIAGGVILWQRYATPPPPPAPLPPLTEQIDRIEIDKAQRILTVFRNGEALRTYPIGLGRAPEGPKTQQGDSRTPEGTFRIDRRNPNSKYNLSLGIDYPQTQHVAQARARGVSPGGDIFIHGQPNAVKGKRTLPGDWTAGCIAVADNVIEELWRITPIGTEVVIRP